MVGYADRKKSNTLVTRFLLCEAKKYATKPCLHRSKFRFLAWERGWRRNDNFYGFPSNQQWKGNVENRKTVRGLDWMNESHAFHVYFLLVVFLVVNTYNIPPPPSLAPNGSQFLSRRNRPSPDRSKRCTYHKVAKKLIPLLLPL